MLIIDHIFQAGSNDEGGDEVDGGDTDHLDSEEEKEKPQHRPFKGFTLKNKHGYETVLHNNKMLMSLNCLCFYRYANKSISLKPESSNSQAVRLKLYTK